MGQEITQTRFTEGDYLAFYQSLQQETALLERLIAQQSLSTRSPVAGFEVEAWLVDRAMQPAPVNSHFLTTLNEPLAFPELAKFNIELNSTPLVLTGNVFAQMHSQLDKLWQKAGAHAESLDTHLLMIGILPTLQQSDLHLGNMSDMHRYQALNEQILLARGQPIHINIVGEEHLSCFHEDVMLEAATTSFQLHIQVPLALAHHFYNASIMASAPMVALAGNAPFLFGKTLWHETRIPLFEQAIETGGYRAASHGPLRRVSFGSGYAQHSIAECFQENLRHFPVLLPVRQDSPVEAFAHLRLHNGTIWRWNRPLIGFDEDGTPHIRIEHRTPAAGPSVVDAMANAAFYYGLAQDLCLEIVEHGLLIPFSQAKDNFYQAARFGLDGCITWQDGAKQHLDRLLQTELLPRARRGLQSLGIAESDSKALLDVIAGRIDKKQTGSHWQRHLIQQRQCDFAEMTRLYLQQQKTGNPVDQWTLM